MMMTGRRGRCYRAEHRDWHSCGINSAAAGPGAAAACRQSVTACGLNISERARWVACLLGRTRGHGRQDIILLTKNKQHCYNNTFDVSYGDVPQRAARPQREERDTFFLAEGGEERPFFPDPK